MNNSVAIGAGVAGLVIGAGLVVAGVLRDRATPTVTSTATASSSQPSPPAPSASQASPGDEAADVVAVLRRDYELVLKCEREDAKWATCHDDEKGGFAKVRACAERSAKACAAVVEAFEETPPLATSACGRSVEAAIRAYANGRSALTKARLAWLDRKQGTLANAIRAKPLAEACAHEACADKPLEIQFEHASFSSVSAIECVKPLFVCDPPLGNVCWLGKVASRLGLGPDAKRGPLRAAATGAELSTPH